MITRILSALVMAPIAVLAIWLGSPYFDALVILVGIAAVIEWYRLISGDRGDGPEFVWVLPGLVYIAVPCLVLVWLRQIEPEGLAFVIWFCVVLWATDIGAYFAGRSIGGPKLAPKISPNKTWAGFFGGILLAVVSSLVLHEFFNPVMRVSDLVLACILLSIVGQLGDLFESWVKRKLGVKDSGALIPGHGGVLDRIDAILLSAPVAGLIAIFFQIGEVPWK